MSNGSETQRKKRGFGSMDPERQREIARLGGQASAASPRGHRFRGKKAREAGRKGGLAISQDREHMSEFGTRGGKAKKTREGSGS